MRTDKRTRLIAKFETGERLRHVVEDPAIVTWFDDAERRLVSVMIDTDSADARQAAAAEARAYRSLRRMMTEAVADARRAKQDLDKLEQEKNR